MLLEADNLTRYYGDTCAVNGITFRVGRGEIVGLLGPNGAGKSTTMRMLSCFLPPSSGTARIAGLDVTEDSIGVRRHIGYMPENNSLYGEMRVREYLRYRAELKGVSRRSRTSRISECMDRCGVCHVRNQLISTLSKGYRQRVGLTDALLGQPDLLILDEPTIGLDPNQIRQTRDTIRDLSQRHTVLISTHILQEVEAICQRALIIDSGRIAADDTVDNLAQNTIQARVYTELKGDAETIHSVLNNLETTEKVTVSESPDGWSCCTIAVTGADDVREDVFRVARENDWALRELTLDRASLEDVFHRLTVTDTEPPPKD